MIVVAGVSGRTGRVVADTLLAQRRALRVVLRDPRQRPFWLERGADVATASLDDASALARAVDGAAGFYALLPEDLLAPDFHAHRRRMAEAIGLAVKTCRVPQVVLLSATAAALADGNGPAQDLHHAEAVLRESGCALTIIRASYFQENVAAALPAARHDGIYPNFLPSADLALPTVATRDVGRLAARCLLEPAATNQVIDLLGPAYSVRQMADKLGAALGKTLRVVDIPAAAHVDVLTRAGLPRQFAEALAQMYACFAAGRVTPRGDRVEAGCTTLDEILPGLVAGS
ncbi:NAD(P)H-binding protein [Piscinibacter sp.]|jgi:uncharacterized protein YbjT (DUF2867 family)|uniref:NmrA family NAD(P)-binding protein n=1 Tax=Piscinibacter sp. TaxID=1903157 RepID=UPI002F4137CB